MAGGGGQDTFKFEGFGSYDIIADFYSPDDGLDFSAVSGVESLLDLNLTETADGVLVTWGDVPEFEGDATFGYGSVLLQYNSLADINANDFLF